MSGKWYERIQNGTWKPISVGIGDIFYGSNLSGTETSIHYGKSVISNITYSIKYEINGENLYAEYISLQISDITSHTDLMKALKENLLIHDHGFFTSQIEDILKMDGPEEEKCTDLNQCGILSILIWIDMLTGKEKEDPYPVYDSQGCFCQHTGKTPPIQRIEICSIDFPGRYCNVIYRIFEFNRHEPAKRTIQLYNTKDGVRAKSSIFVRRVVDSEGDMLNRLKNNLICSIEYSQK